METTELNVESSVFVSALEQVLPRHGYRTMRSFDLRLDSDAASQIPQVEQTCQCGCGYTVLLVFPNAPNAGMEGTISVRGIAERSLVSLLAPDNDGELAAQFPTILVEAVGMKSDDGGNSRRRAQA
ncbi:MAG: hypothetical protein M1434_00755 [Chloroflexi bacterium]|nr:hypothetical protein [Chloroflexota bacterium]MCL5273262.1 hypothetical protein [Chloroflexota bacterium]